MKRLIAAECRQEGIFTVLQTSHARCYRLLCWQSSTMLASTAHADEEYLAPDVAFKFSAKMADAQTIAVILRCCRRLLSLS
jgi:hypothetical protein